MEFFRTLVGENNVITQPGQLQPHLTDWRGRFTGQAMAMVLPESTDQIAQIIRHCRSHKISITPQGGNTSLVGAATPLAEGKNIILNLSRMYKIDSVDIHNQSVLVQSGAILKNVQHAADQSGLTFPLSLVPNERVQIGGALATNAGGLNVLKYGMMRHLTLGIEAVLGTGEIFTQLRPLRKNNFGYAIGELLIGSEGTLGIITRAQLRLFPKPQAQGVLWAGLADFASCVALYQAAQKICGEHLSACEYMNHRALELVAEFQPHLREPLQLRYPHYVLLQLDGGDRASVQRQLAMVGQALPNDADHVTVHDAHAIGSLWELRKSIATAERAQGISIKHDLSLPLGAWEEFMDMAQSQLSLRWPGLQIVAMGHLGDGNLHYNLKPMGLTADNYEDFAQDINRIVFDWTAERNGSPAAEHGVGVLRKAELQRYSTPSTLVIGRSIKNLCDPDGILNPGKVV